MSDTDIVEHPEIRKISDKSSLVAFILCLLFGVLGVHRFYVGKFWTGLLWLLTGGLVLIGWVIDLISILTGTFTDKQGQEVCQPLCIRKEGDKAKM